MFRPDPPIRAIVTDIEGTTTDIAFVRDVLFPYASDRLPQFVADRRHELAIAEIIMAANRPSGQPGLSLDATIDLLRHWIAEDRKAPPLKLLQGLIWEAGYRDGQLVAPVYDDVAPALRAWRSREITLYVYSSGSVAAQKLLFGHCTAGDLAPLFDGYFDTAIGGKLDADSYRAIAREVGQPADRILFLSDHPGEVAAARTAGWQAVRAERDGVPVVGPGPVIGSFAELDL